MLADSQESPAKNPGQLGPALIGLSSNGLKSARLLADPISSGPGLFTLHRRAAGEGLALLVAQAAWGGDATQAARAAYGEISRVLFAVGGPSKAANRVVFVSFLELPRLFPIRTPKPRSPRPTKSPKSVLR